MYLDTPDQRHWLMHLLLEAEDYMRPDDIVSIDQRTEMRHYDSAVEHSLVFNRTSGEHISLTVGKLPCNTL